MTLAVYKYPFAPSDVVEILMPALARVIAVQVQQGVPCIWALVDPKTIPSIVRRFRMVGTGHPFPENVGDHIGTFQLQGGSLVFHLFHYER